MAVSRQTADRITRVMQAYVPLKNIPRLIADLKEIPGNKSFRDTVNMLDEIYSGRVDLGNERR